MTPAQLASLDAAAIAIELNVGSQLADEVRAIATAARTELSPLRWKATTVCFTRFITDARYRKLRPSLQRWYAPVCPDCAPNWTGAASPAPAPAEQPEREVVQHLQGSGADRASESSRRRPVKGDPYTTGPRPAPEALAPDAEVAPLFVFEHKDGRYGVGQSGAAFTSGDPGWSRLGPLSEGTPPPAAKMEAPNEDALRKRFESVQRCSHGHKRSRRGTYRNPPTARDWKWFRLGAEGAASAHPVAPARFARVPLRMTRAMQEVFNEEGWEWRDVLAAAEAITEEQYSSECEDTDAATIERLSAELRAAHPVAPADDWEPRRHALAIAMVGFAGRHPINAGMSEAEKLLDTLATSAMPWLRAAPPAKAADMEELRRALAVISVVGEIDGHRVIRRDSVLDIADRRLAATPTRPSAAREPHPPTRHCGCAECAPSFAPEQDENPR